MSKLPDPPPNQPEPDLPPSLAQPDPSLNQPEPDPSAGQAQRDSSLNQPQPDPPLSLVQPPPSLNQPQPDPPLSLVQPPPPLNQPQPDLPRAIPFWTMQDLAVMIGLALPMMLIAAIVVRLIIGSPAVAEQTPAVAVIAAQFLGYALWFVCLWVVLHFRYGRPFWKAMGWVDPPAGWLRYLVYGPLLAFAVGFGGRLLQTPEIEMPMTELLSDRFSLILVGAFAVTLGPLCEELAFRGFFLPRLSKSLGVVAGVLVTSLVFALLHGPQYAWSWQHILLITMAGAGFCVVRLRTGSTAAATVMHATYNLTFFVAYLTHLEEIGATW